MLYSEKGKKLHFVNAEDLQNHMALQTLKIYKIISHVFMALRLIITGFGLDLLTPYFTITLNHNQFQQLNKWLLKTCSIMTGLQLSSLLVCLLLSFPFFFDWLTWFRFMNDSVLGSPFYCDCFGSYLDGRLYSVVVSQEIFAACSYPWTRLLISQ